MGTDKVSAVLVVSVCLDSGTVRVQVYVCLCVCWGRGGTLPASVVVDVEAANFAFDLCINILDIH